MPSLAELMEIKLKEKKDIKEPEIIPEKVKIAGSIKETKIQKKAKKQGKKASKKEKICPECNRRLKITGEKEMNKHQIIEWFTNFLIENKAKLPLDWLRGQKLTFESVDEMRKI